MSLDQNKFIVTSGPPAGGNQTMVSSAVGPDDVTTNSAKVSNANHTGDATGDTALTLATVNSNVGSFTNADITVNAKGLITAASSGSGGSGDVTGPASATDNNLAVFNGTTGKIIKDGAQSVSGVLDRANQE